MQKAGQSYWQILPLNPTNFGDSPYQSCSTFAGNHYLIDLDMLIADGLLKKEELDSVAWGSDETRVDYGCLYNNRMKLLRLAYIRFTQDQAFHAFVEENEDWLPDYALFMSLKERYPGMDWQGWPEELKLRQPERLSVIRKELAYPIGFQYFLQYEFFRQWKALRSYANQLACARILDILEPSDGESQKKNKK